MITVPSCSPLDKLREEEQQRSCGSKVITRLPSPPYLHDGNAFILLNPMPSDV